MYVLYRSIDQQSAIIYIEIFKVKLGKLWNNWHMFNIIWRCAPAIFIEILTRFVDCFTFFDFALILIHGKREIILTHFLEKKNKMP